MTGKAWAKPALMRLLYTAEGNHAPGAEIDHTEDGMPSLWIDLGGDASLTVSPEDMVGHYAVHHQNAAGTLTVTKALTEAQASIHILRYLVR